MCEKHVTKQSTQPDELLGLSVNLEKICGNILATKTDTNIPLSLCVSAAAPGLAKHSSLSLLF